MLVPTSSSWAALGRVSGFLSSAVFRKSLNSRDLQTVIENSSEEGKTSNTTADSSIAQVLSLFPSGYNLCFTPSMGSPVLSFQIIRESATLPREGLDFPLPVMATDSRTECQLLCRHPGQRDQERAPTCSFPKSKCYLGTQIPQDPLLPHFSPSGDGWPQRTRNPRGGHHQPTEHTTQMKSAVSDSVLVFEQPQGQH